MAEQIIDGIGNGFLAEVTSDNRIKVQTEGISLSGTIATGSEVFVKNFDELGSSVVVTNFGDLGSTRIIIGSVAITTNPIPISGNINVTVGSQVWVQNFGELGSDRTGSFAITNFGVLGSNVTGSVAITNFNVLGSNVVVTNLGDLGSNITGSVAIITSPLITSGVITNLGDLGSSVVVTNFGVLGSDITGSISVNNFGVLGSSRIIEEVSPLDSSKNNPAWKFEYIISGTSTGATGSSIGSVTQFIGAGSFVNVLTYSEGLLTNIGSFS